MRRGGAKSAQRTRLSVSPKTSTSPRRRQACSIGLAVEQRAVAGVEIADPALAGADRDLGVAARDRVVVGDLDVALGAAAEQPAAALGELPLAVAGDEAPHRRRRAAAPGEVPGRVLDVTAQDVGGARLERGGADVAGAVGVAQSPQGSLGRVHPLMFSRQAADEAVRRALDREALAHLVLEAADHLLHLAAGRGELRAPPSWRRCSPGPSSRRRAGRGGSPRSRPARG